MPYKESEEVIRELNCSNTSVNNHIKVSATTNKVGFILNNSPYAVVKLALKLNVVSSY